VADLSNRAFDRDAIHPGVWRHWFADDYIKVVKKRSKGLTVWQKLGLQFVASAAWP